MDGLADLAGLCLLLIGLIGFLDRERPMQARRRYYFYDPSFGVVGRTVASVITMGLGAIVLSF